MTPAAGGAEYRASRANVSSALSLPVSWYGKSRERRGPNPATAQCTMHKCQGDTGHLEVITYSISTDAVVAQYLIAHMRDGTICVVEILLSQPHMYILIDIVKCTHLIIVNVIDIEILRHLSARSDLRSQPHPVTRGYFSVTLSALSRPCVKGHTHVTSHMWYTPVFKRRLLDDCVLGQNEAYVSHNCIKEDYCIS